MNQISEKLEKILLENYKAEDSTGKTVLNKTLVSDHTRAYNPELLALLQSDEDVKNYFFVQVKKAYVFKLENFLTFINNRSFLPDSFKAFLKISDFIFLMFYLRFPIISIVWQDEQLKMKPE